MLYYFFNNEKLNPEKLATQFPLLSVRKSNGTLCMLTRIFLVEDETTIASASTPDSDTTITLLPASI